MMRQSELTLFDVLPVNIIVIGGNLRAMMDRQCLLERADR